MSEFSETPMVQEFSTVAVSPEMSADIASALAQSAEDEEPEQEMTPDGENYPDTEPSVEPDDGEETADDDEDDDGAGDDNSDDPDETEREAEEDEEVQSVVEDLQKQADACGQFLAAKGLDYNAIRERYLEKGKLSRQDINALEKAGLSEELVQGYIEGQQARFEVYAQHVRSIAGGDKEYADLLKWAAKNLSEKEIKHFNKAVDSNDVDEARFAVKGLMAMREKQRGSKPQLIHGKTSRSAAPVKGFRSLAEQAKYQADPRYEHDPEYTRMVDRRILASTY